MSSLLQEAPAAIYSVDDLQTIDPLRIPQHVAVIMDGNRRWAKGKDFPCMMGHWKGIESLIHIVRASAELGIGVLTVFAFSTENWFRSPQEVEGLMHLFKHFLVNERETMLREGVRVESIGDLGKIPEDVLEVLEETKKVTAGCQRIALVLALNYGGRDDIRRAIVSIVSDIQSNKLEKSEISETLISKYLDTARWSDPDLLIRTSGELRLSNFLLWQISYTEVYITERLWPDFDSEDLLDAVKAYQRRERRLGKG